MFNLLFRFMLSSPKALHDIQWIKTYLQLYKAGQTYTPKALHDIQWIKTALTSLSFSVAVSPKALHDIQWIKTSTQNRLMARLQYSESTPRYTVD